ncbi:hypothetical protein QBC34DRAFT_471543 [Podospora aff. communis PSN243]|uniref:NACHT domain-containing protein n=1 Tax=Podospora aff. communis PSN243 TaxID=3040156 RepID=A0AAV9GCD9_9PEZI|nr:hypothetical protein QBC34DRAFT_471543 [Podospora aff. communis PSN243]
MEPLTALAVAGNVLQFFQFASELLSSSRKIYSSAGGSSDENAHLGDICEKLVDFVSSLRISSSRQAPSSPSSHERAIANRADACRKDCEELLAITTKLRAKSTGGKTRRFWNSFKIALAEVSNSSEIEGLRKRIGDHQQTLLLHIGAISSDDIARLRAELGEFRCVWHGANEAKHQEILRSLKALEQHQQSTVTVQNFPARSVADDVERISEDIRNLSIDTRQYGKHGRIFASLNYVDRPLRHEIIPRAHTATFDWALSDHTDTDSGKHFGALRRWLSDDDDLFWVSGKPGCGKSTFMKYVADHPVTKSLLSSWSKDKRVVIAAHYFTIYGSPIQKSLEGLLRSLLYGILRQEPALIPKVLPEPLTDRHEQIRWTQANLEAALKRISSEDCGDKMCFFIDGLDEYSGDHQEICETLVQLSQSPSIKICVSSRPWNVFEDALGGNLQQKLYMHHLTEKDIRNYVEAALCHHPRWQILIGQSGHEPAEALISDTVFKSSGVFLWVTLVTRLLREGLTNDDSIQDLNRRLTSYPSDLDPFFRHILDSVDEFYQDKMARALLLALEAERPLEILLYSLQDLEYYDENYALCEVKTHPSLPPFNHSMPNGAMARRLNGWCKGLLERNGNRMEFLHRTVFDFLHSQDMDGFLLNKARNSRRFCSTLSLLRARVAMLKRTWFCSCPSFCTGTTDTTARGQPCFARETRKMLSAAHRADSMGGNLAMSTTVLLENLDTSLDAMAISGQIKGSLSTAKELYHHLVLEAEVANYLLTKLPSTTYFGKEAHGHLMNLDALSLVLASKSKPFLQWAVKAVVDSGYALNGPTTPGSSSNPSRWAKCIDRWALGALGSSDPSTHTHDDFALALENGIFIHLLQSGADPNTRILSGYPYGMGLEAPAWFQFLLLAVFIPRVRATRLETLHISLEENELVKGYRKTLNLMIRGITGQSFDFGLCDEPGNWFPHLSSEPEALRFAVRVFAESLDSIPGNGDYRRAVREGLEAVLSEFVRAQLQQEIEALKTKRIQGPPPGRKRGRVYGDESGSGVVRRRDKHKRR